MKKIIMVILGIIFPLILCRAENLLKNADFSQQQIPGHPDCWGTGHWGLRKIYTEEAFAEFSRDWGLTADNIFRIHVPDLKNRAHRQLESTWVYLPRSEDKNYTFSVDLKHNHKGQARIQILNGGGGIHVEKYCDVNSVFQRFHITCKLPFSMAKVRILPVSAGALYISRPQLEPGILATEFTCARRYDTPLPSLTVAHDKTTAVQLQEFCGGTLKDQTKVLLQLNSNNLKIIFECDSSYSEEAYHSALTGARKQVNNSHLRNRDSYVWKSPDSVGVMLSPKSSGQDYFRLGLDREEKCFDAHGVNPAWDGQWSGSVEETAYGWRGILTIQLSCLPQGEKIWRANFFRENHLTGENSTWNPSYGMFHIYRKFGFVHGLQGMIPNELFYSVKDPQALPVRMNDKCVIPYAMWMEGDPRRITPQQLKQIASLGFNAVAMEFKNGITDLEFRKILDAAYRQHLKILVVFGQHKPDWEKYIRSYVPLLNIGRDYPGILGWVAMDEPDLWNASIDYQKKAIALIKSIDPRRPAYINYTANQRHDIGLPGDIRSMDHYPVPSMDINSIPDLAAEMGKSLKPVWFCIQSSGYAYFSDREPTAQEFQWMIFSSVVRGNVSGFFCFAQFPHSKDLRRGIRETGRRLKLLQDYYAGQTVKDIIPGVWSQTRIVKGASQILLVNPTNKSIVIPWKCPGNFRDAFNHEKIQGDTLTFSPYQSRFIIAQ